MGHTVLRCPATSSSSAAARPARPSPARCAASSPTPGSRSSSASSSAASAPTTRACRPRRCFARPRRSPPRGLHPAPPRPSPGELDAARVLWHRDQVTGGGDDSSQEEWLADRDIELVRGEAVVREPGLVEAPGRELRYERLMIATGSVPSIPPIAGLDGVDYWTNREATSVREIPASIVVLGAGRGRLRAGPVLQPHGRERGAGRHRRPPAPARPPRRRARSSARCSPARASTSTWAARSSGSSPGSRSTWRAARPSRGRAADRRDRPAGRRRGLRLRGARPRDLEARDRGRRAHARG